jgi:hypothetical protein
MVQSLLSKEREGGSTVKKGTQEGDAASVTEINIAPDDGLQAAGAASAATQ